VLSQPQSGPDVAIGIDGSGRIVGRIKAWVDLRSPDGSHLYALAGNKVDVYSALDGHQEASIALHAVVNAEQEMLSADGHWLAVTGQPETTLELVDLATGHPAVSLRVGNAQYVTPVIVGSQAHYIYLVGDSIAKVTFEGGKLLLQPGSATHALSCQGLVTGGLNSAGGLACRVMADNRTLVAFCPGDGRVTWFDLQRMVVIKEITNPQQNPFWVSPVFSSDGTTLYLHEGGTGRLVAIDLVRQKVSGSVKVALAQFDPLALLGSMLATPVYAGGIPRTAALSPDGNWLYAVGAFGAPGGVSVVHLPDLKVKSRWMPDVFPDSVWVSADGRTIFVLTQEGSIVRLLRPDGSLIGKASLPSMPYGFVVPTTPS
jgi:hypothetical protein